MTTTETTRPTTEPPMRLLQTLGEAAGLALREKSQMSSDTRALLRSVREAGANGEWQSRGLMQDALVVHGFVNAAALRITERRNLSSGNLQARISSLPCKLIPQRSVEANLRLTQRVFEEWPNQIGDQLPRKRAERARESIKHASQIRKSYPQIDLLLDLGALTESEVPPTNPGIIAVRELAVAYGAAAVSPGEQMEAKMHLLRSTGNIHLKNSL